MLRQTKLEINKLRKLNIKRETLEQMPVKFVVSSSML